MIKKRPLGNSGISVPPICLGTMTWGEQNTQEEAHQQLDYAFERGINFIDTAEMYPVPPTPKTYSLTEQYIGRWNKLSSHRDQIILATKVVGPLATLGASHIRDGNVSLDRKNIEQAVDASLQRLGTDYIDLYQLHWPDRHTNCFGSLNYEHKPERDGASIEETMEVLADLAKTGKVRAFGLSNETPWGTMKYLELAKKNLGPKIVSIQNPYNLLNRTYEIGMAEVSQREDAGLLAYSPLAFGVLTGKYLQGQKPKNARLTLWNRFSRYTNPQAEMATEKYIHLAKKFNIDPTIMALSFVTNRSFVTSNIIGATSLNQLKTNIDSIDVELSKELLTEIEKIHVEFPNPAP